MTRTHALLIGATLLRVLASGCAQTPEPTEGPHGRVDVRADGTGGVSVGVYGFHDHSYPL